MIRPADLARCDGADTGSRPGGGRSRWNCRRGISGSTRCCSSIGRSPSATCDYRRRVPAACRRNVPLVKLRGQWVQIDLDAAAPPARFSKSKRQAADAGRGASHRVRRQPRGNRPARARPRRLVVDRAVARASAGREGRGLRAAAEISMARCGRTNSTAALDGVPRPPRHRRVPRRRHGAR